AEPAAAGGGRFAVRGRGGVPPAGGLPAVAHPAGGRRLRAGHFVGPPAAVPGGPGFRGVGGQEQGGAGRGGGRPGRPRPAGGRLARPFPHRRAWFPARPPYTDASEGAEYEEFVAYHGRHHLDGSVVIQPEHDGFGCKPLVLVVSGPERGHLWWDGRRVPVGPT